MATEAEHLEQFARNEATAQRLAAASDFDWSVVALFYASLHLVQAYFVRNGVFVQSHRQRDRQIFDSAELRAVYEPYVAMRYQSELARYQCQRFTRDEYELIRAGSFSQVVQHLQSLGDTR